MNKIILKNFVTFLIFCSLTFVSTAEEKLNKNSPIINQEETEINAFAGIFDFSDPKQHAGLFGVQHQTDELWRETFLGKLSPVTGGFLTENNAYYLYSGVQSEFDLGLVTFTPSFAPGLYHEGDGKDLGSVLEFKSEVKIGMKFIEELKISSNNTILIVGEIINIIIDKDNNVSDDGSLNFEKIKTVCISGLDSYYDTKKIAKYPYAKRDEIPERWEK